MRARLTRVGRATTEKVDILRDMVCGGNMDEQRRLLFEYTRQTKRKTMPPYYSGVMLGNSIAVIWSCKHRHDTRKEAYNCVRNVKPGIRLPELVD